ncbi:hypothetical protein [Streptomyces scabiei]|uniref:Insecticidal crystal toxin domain-containing protein n=1 Tax=Streptomyces scabiei TaxID=1930 RepID=A0A124C4P1_STRSC|nr:hypothetical protein [Streptomyces scabiei]GAQ65048.1 hypothetical protein SsS58_05455 [Streptomyces scabiei]
MITRCYGDLEIGYTTRWNGSVHAGTASRTGAWRTLGSVFGGGFVWNWQDAYGALVVQDRSAGQDLLKPPVDFQHVGRFPGFSVLKTEVWRPVPPAGYVALGDVANWSMSGKGVEKPDASALGIVCVKKEHNGRSYVRRAELGRLPLLTNGNGKGLWAVTPPLYPFDDTEEHLFLHAGTFSCGPDTPHGPTAVTWVLDLPAVVDTADYAPELRLESYNAPPAQAIVTDRAVTVPYFMVKDDARSEAWKVANSPFCKIQRKRQYDLIRHVDFRSAGGGQIAETVEEGVSKERGEEFALTTGITVGVTAGVEASAKPFGVGASVSVETSVSASVELGYTTRYGVSTFENKSVSVTFDVPAGHAGALWTDTHQLVPIRRDGTLVTNANLRLNAGDSGSYVGRTFPETAQSKVSVVRKVSDMELKAAEEMGIDLKTLADVTEIPQ